MARTEFKLSDEYQRFLRLMNLQEANMHPMQKRQIKQTFYGACGQILRLLHDEVSALPEKDAIFVMDDLEKQVLHFFLEDTNQMN